MNAAARSRRKSWDLVNMSRQSVTSKEGLDGRRQEQVRGHQHKEDTTSVSQSDGVPAIENSRDSEWKKE